MNSSQYFNLFASCKLVSGANRSCIFDFDRVKYHFIPNALYDIIKKYNGNTKIGSIYKKYPDNEAELDDYFNFLDRNELIFFSKDNVSHIFPRVSEHHSTPFALSNAVLAVNSQSSYSIVSVCKELSDIGTNHIQLRIFSQMKLTELLRKLGEISELGFRSIEILVKDNPTLDDHGLLNLVDRYRNIAFILTFSAEKNITISKGSKAMGIIIKQKAAVHERQRYYFKSPDYFFLNNQIFHENKHYNAYYNESLSVSSKGEIKNALFHEKVFGHVQLDRIEQILSETDFCKLWLTRKDESIGCMDCEYRYVCSDNRIPKKSLGDQYWSFDEPCAYNPYTSQWATT